MLKKIGLVAATLVTGLLLAAPAASATTGGDWGHHPPKPPKGGGGDHSVVDNRGCKAGNGIGNISCNPVGVSVGDVAGGLTLPPLPALPAL